MNAEVIPWPKKITVVAKPPLVGKDLQDFLGALGRQTQKATMAQEYFRRSQETTGEESAWQRHMGMILMRDVFAIGIEIREIEKRRSWA